MTSFAWTKQHESISAGSFLWIQITFPDVRYLTVFSHCWDLQTSQGVEGPRNGIKTNSHKTEHPVTSLIIIIIKEKKKKACRYYSKCIYLPQIWVHTRLSLGNEKLAKDNWNMHHDWRWQPSADLAWDDKIRHNLQQRCSFSTATTRRKKFQGCTTWTFTAGGRLNVERKDLLPRSLQKTQVFSPNILKIMLCICFKNKQMNKPIFVPTDSYQLIIKPSWVSLGHISEFNVLIKIRTCSS